MDKAAMGWVDILVVDCIGKQWHSTNEVEMVPGIYSGWGTRRRPAELSYDMLLVL